MDQMDSKGLQITRFPAICESQQSCPTPQLGKEVEATLRVSEAEWVRKSTHYAQILPHQWIHQRLCRMVGKDHRKEIAASLVHESPGIPAVQREVLSGLKELHDDKSGELVFKRMPWVLGNRCASRPSLLAQTQESSWRVCTPRFIRSSKKSSKFQLDLKIWL